eukprot:CAMPEP_0172529936 /NCGR_PEP_ID=MMETSP1067-20121228/3856_1 /TAXON_ID=265564 ORGANISM="Thalassiosira punctigera, Strain Tpunct2005C2" /NCGR_SAMPLE_ID=MMETSP1067 /ASSEMBLY_ACC=CAM_ASM_000444 /LENGTH=450 /DNA_ID=CAMNT_0013314071 /DNA_START=696 /DNA_END=2051 /DNA_ORIENTATION=-
MKPAFQVRSDGRVWFKKQSHRDAGDAPQFVEILGPIQRRKSGRRRGEPAGGGRSDRQEDRIALDRGIVAISPRRIESNDEAATVLLDRRNPGPAPDEHAPPFQLPLPGLEDPLADAPPTPPDVERPPRLQREDVKAAQGRRRRAVVRRAHGKHVQKRRNEFLEQRVRDARLFEEKGCGPRVVTFPGRARFLLEVRPRPEEAQAGCQVDGVHLGTSSLLGAPDLEFGEDGQVQRGRQVCRDGTPDGPFAQIVHGRHPSEIPGVATFFEFFIFQQDWRHRDLAILRVQDAGAEIAQHLVHTDALDALHDVESVSILPPKSVNAGLHWTVVDAPEPAGQAPPRLLRRVEEHYLDVLLPAGDVVRGDGFAEGVARPAPANDDHSKLFAATAMIVRRIGPVAAVCARCGLLFQYRRRRSTSWQRRSADATDSATSADARASVDGAFREGVGDEIG